MKQGAIAGTAAGLSFTLSLCGVALLILRIAEIRAPEILRDELRKVHLG